LRRSKPLKMQACEPTFLSSIGRTSMGPITALPGLLMMPPAMSICAPLVNRSTSLGWSTRQRRRNSRPMQPRGPACSLKAQCTPSPSGRQVHRSFHADYLERVKSYYQTEAYQKALRKRKGWVEPLFGEAKEWHGMRRFRLRRLWRVNCEALVIAAGQNLKRWL
jgi:Transposase DDE domain